MLPVEQWNAQISLLTGFGAASLMVYARVGLLRTLPPPDPRDVQRLHRTAKALGIEWPAEQLYPDFIRSLDPTEPAHAAMVVACTRLLRGSGYVAFDGEVPAEPQHSALASEYAHVTAPLRRLGRPVRRRGLPRAVRRQPVPDWVLAALPDAAEDDAGVRRPGRAPTSAPSSTWSRPGCSPHRVGEEFDAVVVSVDEKDPTRGVVMLKDPGVEAPVVGVRRAAAGHGRPRHAGDGRRGDAQGGVPALDRPDHPGRVADGDHVRRAGPW